MYEDDAAPSQKDPDRLTLDELKFPSGQGWARFKDPNRLTGREVSRIREAAGSVKNEALAGQALMHKALAELICEWQIEYRPNAQLPIYDPKVFGGLYSEDLVALERHILPVLDMLNPGKERSVP